MGRCKYCGAEIDWIRTPEGENIPVNPVPVFVTEHSIGDVFYTDEGRKITGNISKAPIPRYMEVGFVPHIRTCNCFG